LKGALLVVCCACSVEAMFHWICHKLPVWILFCVPCLFELLTALLEYLNLLRVAVPLPSGLLHLYDCDYEIYNIVHSLIIAGEPIQLNNHTTCPTYVFIVWKEDASLPAMFNPLCSSTNQQLFKRTFAIKVATMKITDDLMEVITCLPLNRHFLWWTKMNGTQRRAMLSPWRTHCMYSSTAKGTSQAEATSKSEKIRPVALAIVELHESEGIRQAVS